MREKKQASNLPAVVFAVFCLALFFGFLGNFPLPLLDHLRAWLGALGVALAAYALGAYPARRLGLCDGLPGALAALGLGYGGLSLLVFLLGVAGWLGTYSVGVPSAALALLGLVLARHRLKGARLPALSWPGAALLVFAAVSFFSALAPPTYSDALVYHLALPAKYLRQGTLEPWLFVVYSHFPQLGELGYLPALVLGGDLAVQLLHASFGLATAAVLYACGAKLWGKRQGLIAALIFYCCPLVAVLSGMASIDLLLSFYAALASMLALGQMERATLRGMLAVGLFCGMALATKYIGLVLLWLFPVLLVAGKTRRLAWLVPLAALAVYLPWGIKNVVYTGNPFYPLFYSALGGEFWSAAQSARYLAELESLRPVGNKLLGMLLAPWRLSVGTKCYLLHGVTGLAFLLFLPFSFLKPRPRGLRRLVSLALPLFLLWAVSYYVPRFLAPVLPLLAAWSALGFCRLEQGGKFLRLAARGALALVVAYNLLLVFVAAAGRSVLEGVLATSTYSRGEATLRGREAYLMKKLDHYGAASYINSNTAADAKVLLVGETRPYYFRRRLVLNVTHDKTAVDELMKGAETPGEMNRRLKEEGITHVLINPDELARWHGEKGYLPWHRERYQAFRKALRSWRLVYTDANCQVYSAGAKAPSASLGSER